MTDWLRKLSPGDRVTRMLGGSLPMEMQVVEVAGDTLLCGAVQPDGSLVMENPTEPVLWTFCRKTGGEIDADLGWFPPRTPTGSILTKTTEH